MGSALVPPVALVILGACGLAGLVAGCDTVDLGEPPADVNACRPSETFFVERVWPEFLSRDFAGKRCSDSGCHDAASARRLRLPAPSSPPGLPLPADWGLVYRSATDQLICTSPGASPLITKPSGQASHGGNLLAAPLIEPDGPEAALVRAWVEAR
jgi:hypothetical protein